MVSFKNLAIDKLMILAKLRNIDVYKNMSMQWLGIILATLPTPKPYPRPAPTPLTPKLSSRSAPKTRKSTPKNPIPTSRPKKNTFDGYKWKKTPGAIKDVSMG